MRALAFSVFIAAISLAAVAQAQNGSDAAGASTAIVRPQGELPLRSAPPGFFTGKGAQIGTVEPDNNYVILERKSVPSVFGNEEWIKLQAVTPDGSAGWVLGGRGPALENFKPGDQM